MSTNVFVLGLDEMNLDPLHRQFSEDDYRFYQLLSIAELQEGTVDLTALLSKATAQLDAFEGSIHAIVGYWDFPISSMVPILSRRYGLDCCADLTAVAKCEHKYWSRIEQRKVTNALPRSALIDLAHDTRVPDGLSYPVWLKPVKAFSSELAFRASDDAEFADAAKEISADIGRVGDAFDVLLNRIDAPEEIAEAGGNACMVEEAVSGSQFTLEGYSRGGVVHIYGAIDSIKYPDSSSFLRYQYPSELPSEILARASDISRAVVTQIGLDSTTFNIEFFADLEQDELTILEVNPRHSQSHARLFEDVDGTPNHECMVRLALDCAPRLRFRQGPYQKAAKWYWRHFTDAFVRARPTEADVAWVEENVPGSTVQLVAPEGQWLSEEGHDKDSYELATIHIGADSEDELVEKYRRCRSGLPFHLEEI